MRHRRQIEMINADDSPEKILTQALASPHTRLPVFRNDINQVVGIVHMRQIARLLTHNQLSKEALEAAGVRVGKTPSETARLMREVIAAL